MEAQVECESTAEVVEAGLFPSRICHSELYAPPGVPTKERAVSNAASMSGISANSGVTSEPDWLLPGRSLSRHLPLLRMVFERF